MKTIIYLFLICLMFLSNSSCAQSQNDVADKQAVQMLKEFYNAYNTTWATTKGYVLIKKLDSLQRRYCTNKLRNEVKEFGLDHDPLVGDGYTDVEHLKTLTVTKDSTKANAYVVFYTVHTLSASNKPIDEKVAIHLTVVKDGGHYKIATVK